MNIVKSRAARLDLIGHYFYLGCDSPETADRFLVAAETTLHWLAAAPRAGREWGGKDPVTRRLRVWPVAGFPTFRIFYRIGSDTLQIVRVLHGSRDLDRALGRR